ncbi:hypothetical protein [Rhodanobacter lindaniclasticus]
MLVPAALAILSVWPSVLFADAASASISPMRSPTALSLSALALELSPVALTERLSSSSCLRAGLEVGFDAQRDFEVAVSHCSALAQVRDESLHGP